MTLLVSVWCLCMSSVCVHMCTFLCTYPLVPAAARGGAWHISLLLMVTDKHKLVAGGAMAQSRSVICTEVKVLPLGSVDAKILPPFVCVWWWWGGGCDLLLLCLMVCAPLPFSQSSERRGSRWEGSDVRLESPFPPPPS